LLKHLLSLFPTYPSGLTFERIDALTLLLKREVVAD
jgi:hypothetical protein